MPGFRTALLALLLLLPDVARADRHDDARAARERGEILPLARILEQAERDFTGRLLEVELDDEHGRWIYEIKLLAEGGIVIKAAYDARTGDLLVAKGHGIERARRRRH